MGNLKHKVLKQLYKLLILNNDRAGTKILACGFTIFLALSLPSPQTLKLELYENKLLISTFKKNKENKESEGKWKELLRNLTE